MRGKMGLVYPLNCPFCDEPAFQQPRRHRVVDFDAVYTVRQCPMGHTFYSVEYVPEDQDEVEKYLRARKRNRELERNREYMRKYRQVMQEREEEYDGQDI